MTRYVLRRVLSGVVTIFFVATFTFFAMHFVPGDPLMKDKAVTEEIRKNLERKYGLDKPLLTQYWVFMTNMLKGDFGISYTQQNRSVNDIIKNHFPISAALGGLALVIATCGGILMGALASLRRNQFADRAIMFMVILFISAPSFVFAAIAQLGVSEFSKRFGFELLPVAGWGTVKHMLLPSLILGLGTMAFMARLMRSSLLEVLNQDYIRTARAKGLSPSRIFFHHQLRNAILPIVTYLGASLAAVTTGGFVAEVVFAIPGLGRYFVQAVQQLDYTVIMGLTVFYGAYLVLMMIIVDVIYGWVDPRIRVAS